MTSGLPAKSGPEIQAALRGFVRKWSDYDGGERAEAQSFLNELILCYGTDRFAAGMRFEYHLPGVGFMDMFWPDRALIEMKAPSQTERLEAAQAQAERYWRASEAPDGSYDAVRYVVLCSFRRFLIWDMRRPSRPAANLALADLPDQYEALMFLIGGDAEASFVEHHRELTREAAEKVALVYQSLKDRAGAPLDEIQRFVMQCVWVMFAEDLEMLENYPFQVIVERLHREKEPNAARDLGWLFTVLNQKGAQNRKGELVGTRYVNGELFERPASVDLNAYEITLFCAAAAFDWRKVDPTIFGSLMEGVLGRERRWELGAHYTHEVDIMKIVGPTIVRPWQERIDACTSPTQARDLLDELCAFRVLDPACGCGNFLYVAYRELRALEALLKKRTRDLAAEQGLPVPPGPWPFVPLANMQGIDLEPIAVLIARVTLWMGHRQMIELYGEAEPPLPLVTLTGVRAGDALRVDWPETDTIIGNPPFLGDSNMRSALGDEYLRWLVVAFDVGIKDFCVYWFRRAHAHLRSGQRAGLVGTNSISQNRARSVSLQYIVDNGGTITDAVSSQKWPGDAKVHVSLVNWVKGRADGPFQIDGVDVCGIDAALHSADPAGWRPVGLALNAGRAFEGASPKAGGFLLGIEEAASLIEREPAAAEVVRPYLVSADIAEVPGATPSRWAIDYQQMSLEDARKFAAPMRVVSERVRPVRELNRRKARRERWWLFGEQAVGMRSAVADLERFAVAGRVGKRFLIVWVRPPVLPSDATTVFAFSDDFSMGLLLSQAHVAWAWARASTLKGDLRYTPTSVFATLPWPDKASDHQREVVAEACRRLLARRSEICVGNNIGLTTLYNAIDEGAYADLKALHRELDEAVAACYGWSKSIAQDDAEIVTRLTELNRQINTGEREYHPFTYLDAENVATE